MEEELQDWMALVYRRIQRIKMLNGGEWPHGQAIDLTSQEAKAILTALEIAGEL